MLYSVMVRGPWTGNGTRANKFRPQFVVDYPTCSSTLVSGVPGDPDCDVEALVPDQATADALAADETYTCWNWVELVNP